jgi:hypothetical protein
MVDVGSPAETPSIATSAPPSIVAAQIITSLLTCPSCEDCTHLSLQKGTTLVFLMKLLHLRNLRRSNELVRRISDDYVLIYLLKLLTQIPS